MFTGTLKTWKRETFSFLLYLTLKECLGNPVGRVSFCWLHNSGEYYSVFLHSMTRYVRICGLANYNVNKPKISALFSLWVNNIHCDLCQWYPQSPMTQKYVNNRLEHRYRVRKTWVLIPIEIFTTAMKLGKLLNPEASLFSSVNGTTITYLLGL